MNFHILAKKNLGPGVAYNKFTTVRPHSLRGKGVGQKCGNRTDLSLDWDSDNLRLGGKGSKDIIYVWLLTLIKARGKLQLHTFLKLPHS